MLIRLILLILLLTPVAGWTLYKPMRVSAPDWNGVSCVSEEVCVEEFARREEAMSVYQAALQFVNVSVGAVRSNPRTTFCSSVACFRAFGFDSPVKSVTIGVSGIVVGPAGWDKHLLRHEIIHHLQSERLGVVGQWVSPNWFKEGMAYSLSEEPRTLDEPLSGYREEFDNWYQRVGKESLWQEARKL